jgi:hypothetical protein
MCAALFALALAGNTEATVTPNVRGTAPTFSSPKMPTGCFVDEPCDPPIGAVSTVVSFSRPGHATVRVRAVDGTFALHLAPGTYSIGMTPATGDVTPATVRVPRVGVVRLRLAVQPTP